MMFAKLLHIFHFFPLELSQSHSSIFQETLLITSICFSRLNMRALISQLESAIDFSKLLLVLGI